MGVHLIFGFFSSALGVKEQILLKTLHEFLSKPIGTEIMYFGICVQKLRRAGRGSL